MMDKWCRYCQLREYAKHLAAVLQVSELHLYATSVRFNTVNSEGLSSFKILPADESL